MSNQLVEIQREQWISLRDMYLVDWPNNLVGFYTVDNFIQWVQKEPKIENLKFYSLNGNWSDGTILVIDRYQLFINTLDKNLERLTTALSLLDWAHDFKICTFYERIKPAVLNVIKDKKLEQECQEDLTALYYLPRSEASKIEINCPPHLTLKPLSENDAEVVNEVWPHRHEGSLYFLKRLIRLNLNIGAYTEDGELVAWCLRLQLGALGALQVKESHKRQGLGSLVTKAMAKTLADMNQDTFAFVIDNNTPSRSMFEKLGFKAIDNAIWLRAYQTAPLDWKDE